MLTLGGGASGAATSTPALAGLPCERGLLSLVGLLVILARLALERFNRRLRDSHRPIAKLYGTEFAFPDLLVDRTRTDFQALGQVSRLHILFLMAHARPRCVV